ncbi:hypothetical protein BKA64DRAFT_406562 [Cadophora sp. MPI-SDFR-AT-0126]|nr:hypothetical protein BKA64DRAFT_406562 [Leotiomycetes sp. MPI-SDFR-AT-0126]
MVSFTRLITVLVAWSALGTNAFLPVTWTGVWSPLPFMVATKWGNRGSHVVTAGQAAWVHIYDCIRNCRDSEENPRDDLECVNAVMQAAFGFGLAVLSYQTIATWTKRDTINADAILNLLPDSVKITDIKLFREAIVTNKSSPTFRRRELHADEPPINVAYNGNTPFTFVMHHQVHEESVAVPIFLATSG